MVLFPGKPHSKMSTNNTTKQYAPTATARPTWRDREAQKQREEREAILRAKEEAELKKFALTEENFPSLMRAVERMTVPDLPAGKFAELASKLNAVADTAPKEETLGPMPTIRNKSKRFQRADDDKESYISVREEEEPVANAPKETLNEKYPPHGKRGTYSGPDHEGWRYVLKKKAKKTKRTLTEAELQRKYREEFFGERDEDGEVNAEIAESNQRREFY